MLAFHPSSGWECPEETHYNPAWWLMWHVVLSTARGVRAIMESKSKQPCESKI